MGGGVSAVLAGCLQGRLSPVGEPIVLARRQGPNELLAATGYNMALVNSGTAALSLAMSLAKRRQGGLDPEVIIPAYGCPDLLAAANFAGVRPVLVDIGSRSPRYQLAQVERAISPNTVAIVAVNFLGIAEDLAALGQLASSRGLLLIEDDAQFMPLEFSSTSYCGDLVVHSFGRGKPISQLGGGALMCQAALADEMAILLAESEREVLAERTWRVKAQLFNVVLHPLVYQWLLRVPFLDIGATQYKPLRGVERLASWRCAYLQANLDAYQMRAREAQALLDEALADIQGIDSLAHLQQSRCQPLLRYPLLCADRDSRDALLAKLQRAGLGASSMYGRPLPAIDGIPSEIVGDYPGAGAFADCLLTLPVTSFVRVQHLQAMRQVLADSLAR
jgi:dTDP-4-amino-4,6-dideoxygalactose transaminase